MRLYLDDDTAGVFLVRLLRQSGHDVQGPADAGMSGADDAVHLTHAIRDRRVMVSGNYRDFEVLHDLVIQAGGHLLAASYANYANYAGCQGRPAKRTLLNKGPPPGVKWGSRGNSRRRRHRAG